MNGRGSWPAWDNGTRSSNNGSSPKARLAQLSLFAVPALAMSLIFKDVDFKGLHYRA
jgi:hypothetical protein